MSVNIDVLDRGFVRLDACCARDIDVINAARVSFGAAYESVMDARNTGLLRYLMRNKHLTPFEHNFFRFHVKAPIFVAREHMRHRVGHSYNEQSGRYSVLQRQFYIPAVEQIRTQVGKPGAYTFEPMETEDAVWIREVFAHEAGRDYDNYLALLDKGLAKEVARNLLPFCLYTQYYWSCNARSLMHWLGLRGAEDAQFEIREYANAVETIFADAMPVTYEAWVEEGRQ